MISFIYKRNIFKNNFQVILSKFSPTAISLICLTPMMIHFILNSNDQENSLGGSESNSDLNLISNLDLNMRKQSFKKKLYFYFFNLIQNDFSIESKQNKNNIDTSYGNVYDNNINESEGPNVVAKPKLVILGSGWGSISLLKTLYSNFFDISIVSPDNYFLFTPLLPSAVVGTIHLSSLIEPLRKLCSRKAKFYLAKANSIDIKNKSVECVDDSGCKFQIPYDFLIISVGSEPSNFGIEDVSKYAHFLKNLQDAKKLRKDILVNFEKAILPTTSEEEKSRLLHFVVVGGGPTGVELAAEIRDLVQEDLKFLLPKDLRKCIKISLIQSASHILNSYDEKISIYTEKIFSRNDIKVIANARVTGLSPSELYFLKDGVKNSLSFGLCSWTAGVRPNSFVRRFCADIPEQNHSNAIITDHMLRVKGIRDGSIFAIGDCSTIETPILKDILRSLLEESINEHPLLTYEELKPILNRVINDYPRAAVLMNHLKILIWEGLAERDSKKLIVGTDIYPYLDKANLTIKAYPLTAQVASQQGKYLGHYFNSLIDYHLLPLESERRKLLWWIRPSFISFHFNKDVIQTMREPAQVHEVNKRMKMKTFQYKHLGTTTYIGDESAVFEFGSNRKYLAFDGFGSIWLWRSIYLNEQVSLRTKLLVAMEWIFIGLFGRDIGIY